MPGEHTARERSGKRCEKVHLEMTPSTPSFLLTPPSLPAVAYQVLALIYFIYLSYGQFCGLNTPALPVGILLSV